MNEGDDESVTPAAGLRPASPKIVSLEERRRDGVRPLLSIVSSRSCLCEIVIVEKTRAVVCRLCGKTWDAFEALTHYAREHERFARNRELLRQDVDRLEKRRRELMHELRTLNARAARAKSRQSG